MYVSHPDRFMTHIIVSLSSHCTVYRPHLKQRSDAEIMRDAKLEARGLPPQEERKPRHDKPQMATDELVRGLAPTRRRYDLTLALGHGTVQETNAKIAWMTQCTSFDCLSMRLIGRVQWTSRVRDEWYTGAIILFTSYEYLFCRYDTWLQVGPEV